ncbi:MAG: DNA polymerase III subunit gamma/tau [Muribaculaceae bacterium]|nr:DNA polymerase III subunit gamma/tau [Muribaculaceae bacterium]
MTSKKQYIVSARKYRPATFQTVVGQRALTATLKNAILGGKLAQAYLFCGPRGVGKTSCARIFAKTINCQHPTADGEACGECESCKAIERGSSFNLVELDAASNNSVEDIRNITDQVNIPAQDGRYRVFIIDEVHMLSNSAFNAFLKTLEEPPKNVVFILATTERHKVIPTILSRCQVYDFRRITINDMIDHLAYVAESEGVKAEREALGVIALKADGAMRDALSIFDQVVASTQGELTYQNVIEALNLLDQEYYFRLLDLFRAGDVAGSLLTFKEISDKGFDAQFFINGLADHIRNLMVSADPRTVVLLETSEEQGRRYSEQAPKLPVEWYYSAMKLLNDADFNYRTSGNKRLLVELTLIRLARLLGGGESRVPFEAPDGNEPQAVPANKVEAKEPLGEFSQRINAVQSQTVKGPSEAPIPSKPSKPVMPKEGARRPAARPTSFRLNAEGSQSKNESKAETDRPVSQEEFVAAWEEFASNNSEQKIMTGAMRGTTPTRLTATDYKIEVDHPAHKQAFESGLGELLAFLRQKLGNDRLTLQVEIREKGEEEKKMNSKEFLKLALDENPELANFLKSINAELE